MSKPIPDEVLRRLADTHIVRYLPDPGEEEDGVLLGRAMLEHLDDCVKGGFYFEVSDESAAGLRCDLRDLARELLALRDAAKKSVDAYHGCCECCGEDVISSDEAIRTLSALLPEEPG